MKKNIDPQEKKRVVKDIIRALHGGLDPKRAAARVLEEAGYLTAGEIAAIEQELMGEGIPPEEIQKFCNVHALIFEKALEGKSAAKDDSSIIQLLHLENEMIKKQIGVFRDAFGKKDFPRAADALESFSIVVNHYIKKENALFPLLEKRGFTGPSKVMWGKHDEVRRLWKETRAAFALLPGGRSPDVVRRELVEPLIAEIEGMVEKEELILFPTSLEKLTAEDLEKARAGFIDLERETVDRELKANAGVDSTGAGASGEVGLPSGRLSVTELTRILNLLPVDVSFVDSADRVKYFSEPVLRIFPRARSVIGRQVQNCHPPKSLKAVENIIKAFKEGRKDSVDFWINLQGKMILIKYLAVRDEAGNYLGTLEVSQDVTGIRALEGEKRLLDGGDL